MVGGDAPNIYIYITVLDKGGFGVGIKLVLLTGLM